MTGLIPAHAVHRDLLTAVQLVQHRLLAKIQRPAGNVELTAVPALPPSAEAKIACAPEVVDEIPPVSGDLAGSPVFQFDMGGKRLGAV
jgi:hypothetical protein